MKIHLKPGDIVDVVAPASSCSDAEFSAALKYIESLGLVPRYNIDFRKPKRYLANDDFFRAEDLHRAFMAPDSKVVWALRGGYGSARVLPLLRKMPKPKKKKVFIGLSDISNLHQFVSDVWGSFSLHAPVLSRMGGSEPSAKEKMMLKDCLFKFEDWHAEHGPLKALNEAADALDEVKASLVGGNLCSLCSLAGTEFSLETKNKIVFLEEVSERGYKIDRFLFQLRHSSDLDSSKAIVFGDFVGGDEPDGNNFVKAALTDFAREMRVPVFSGVKSGHGKYQLPLLLGAKSSLKRNDKGKMLLINGRKL